MLMRRSWLLAGLLLALVLAPIGWYLLSPLWITRTVNEEFPIAQAAAVQPSATAAISDTQASATPAARATVAATAAAPTPMPATATPQPTATTLPAEPAVLKQGAFHPVTHEGEGRAAIYQLPDGQRVLRLEDFSVLNGPDLYVWLSSAADASDARTILSSQYVELGRLKGNQGNQNYTLPADLDLSGYSSVTIWCRQFGVNFATAPLR